jgi:hypothetical protein
MVCVECYRWQHYFATGAILQVDSDHHRRAAIVLRVFSAVHAVALTFKSRSQFWRARVSARPDRVTNIRREPLAQNS